IRWQAEKGQVLPLLFEPAVLTRIGYPTDALRLERNPEMSNVDGASCSTNRLGGQQLVAKKKGVFNIEFQYQISVVDVGSETGIYLPVQPALVDRLNLTLVNMDAEVASPQAVSVHTDVAGKDTVSDLVLGPAGQVWVGWKPRTRDVKHEKPVFYAELSQ